MLLTSNITEKSDFYIARVGSKAGMPMWNNYTSNNAFSVTSDDPKRDFQFALHLYRSKKPSMYTLGTCQPSIRIRDIRKLLSEHKVSSVTLQKMAAVDALILASEEKLEKLKELQSALARMR